MSLSKLGVPTHIRDAGCGAHLFALETALNLVALVPRVQEHFRVGARRYPQVLHLQGYRCHAAAKKKQQWRTVQYDGLHPFFMTAKISAHYVILSNVCRKAWVKL